MKKINFKEFVIKTDISGSHSQTVDVRESFANIIYTRVNGIKAHSLALAIYRSNSEIEVSTEEAELVKAIAEQFCTPAFIDAINEQLKD